MSATELRRILIVDDDPGIREVLSISLLDEGYDAVSAVDGVHALEILRSWRPDLIVLDLMMPRMDGWSFRQAQYAISEIASIPLVVLSATHNLQSAAQSMAASAVISKPFDLEAVLETIEQILGPDGLRATA